MARVQDAASSAAAAAVATPSRVSVAAKLASDEQTEKRAVETFSFGNFNDKHPCDGPNLTGNYNEASKPDPDVVEAVFSSQPKEFMVGEHSCPYPVGVFNSKKDEAEVNLVERLPEIEDDEIKSKRPGSEREYGKKGNDDLKKEQEVFHNDLQLRACLSSFEGKPEGRNMDAALKAEVLKLPEAKSERFGIILGSTSYTKTLRTMFFQSANMTLKSSFECSKWRKYHRFPKFSNDGDDYKWWKENYDLGILEKRLEILRVAAKNLGPELDMFMTVERVSKLNSKLHPQPSENELNETDEDKMRRLLTSILSLLSGE